MSTKALTGALLTLFALFFTIPILWLLLASSKSPAELIDSSPYAPGPWGR